MKNEGKPIPAALGFRVKSGWAMAALVAGPPQNPRLVKCGKALLSDPDVPKSVQPHHAALNLPENEGRAITQKLREVVRAAAARSVAELLAEAANSGYAVRAAACVVGSLVDPTTLHNEHIRAHGLEGQLFRTVLEDAFRQHGIPCEVVLEKDAYERAATALRTTAAGLKRSVAELGESHEGPWRAEEKLASLAAWVALKTGR